MQNLLNSSNYGPIRDLRLFQELLAIYQIIPETIESVSKKHSNNLKNNGGFHNFEYKLLMDMIANDLPNYSGNLSGSMNTNIRVNGSILSSLLKIILSKKININQTIANIESALRIATKKRDLFGFVLYEGMTLPNEIIDRLKNDGMELQYGIVGRYQKVASSKHLGKLILEDEKSFDPSLKAAFAVTWNIAETYYRDGSKERPFYVWASKHFLIKPFIMPPAKEVLTIEKGKTYKREFTIPR